MKNVNVLSVLWQTEAVNLYASFSDKAKCYLKQDNIYNANKITVFITKVCSLWKKIFFAQTVSVDAFTDDGVWLYIFYARITSQIN